MQPLFRLPLLALVLAIAACDTGPTPSTSGPDIQFDPSPVDFGYVVPGEYSVRTVVVSNEGRSATTIENVGPTDDSVSVFYISAGPTFPHILPSGNSTELELTFAPTTADVFVQSFELDLGDDGTETLSVGGCSTAEDCTTDIPSDDDDSVGDDDDDDDDTSGDDDDDTSSGDPQVNSDTASVDFGQVPSNQAPVSDVIRLSNTGGAPLIVSSVTVVDGSYFVPTGFNGGTLNPGASPVNIRVEFNPFNVPVGVHTATLRIASNDPDEASFDIPLRAEVIEDCGACQPVLDVPGATRTPNPLGNPAEIIYLVVNSGLNSVTLGNSGFGTLQLGAITEGGQIVTDNPSITVTGGDSPPFSLNPGDTATLEITVSGTGCEVINFGGSYGFTVGTVADAFGCFGG